MREPNSGQAWGDIREEVLERDSYQCRFCGTTDEEHSEKNSAGLDVHHIIPKADGGPDAEKNLVALCRSCHRTLERLHGQAMGVIAGKEDYSRTLEGLNKTWDQYKEELDECNDTLETFVSENPVFSNKFGLFLEQSNVERPTVDSRELRRLAKNTNDTISSEWGCVARFAYKEGVADVLYTLDGRTGLPFEEFREESGENDR